MQETIKLGNGIVLFKSRIPYTKEVIDFLSELKSEANTKHYSFIKDSEGNILYATNKSGHRFSVEDIEKNCKRITDFYEYFSSNEIKNFFIDCENIIYKTLLEYGSIYPMVIPCLWWKTMGHVLAYGTSSDLGLHCDNDINYQPKLEPDYQLGTRHVLAAITYFNSSVDEYDGENFVGGKINFPYAECSYSPCAGDILMFPANFIATHEVTEVTVGERYAYLEYFGQGSSHPERGINITDPRDDLFGGQVWLHELFKDYERYITDTYDDDSIDLMLLPIARQFNSQNTRIEVEK
jgi:hypothetical protein